MKTHDELKKQYRDTPIRPGIVLVHNTKTHEFSLGAVPNPEGALNRLRFTLKMGSPTDPILANPKILEDYRALGEAALEFKVLDTLKPKEGEEGTAAEDLKALEKMWREELLGRGWKAY